MLSSRNVKLSGSIADGGLVSELSEAALHKRSLMTGAASTVHSIREHSSREALSLAPWLQPGDKGGFHVLNRFNGLPGRPKPLKRLDRFMITGRGHRAEATVLMRTLRVDLIGLFVQSN